MSVYTEEYGPAVVHELTERGGAGTGGTSNPQVAKGHGEPRPLAPRSVSVVCRLCHGDLDESLFCSLCGVVTLP
jgi:hypothetical protein